MVRYDAGMLKGVVSFYSPTGDIERSVFSVNNRTTIYSCYESCIPDSLQLSDGRLCMRWQQVLTAS